MSRRLAAAALVAAVTAALFAPSLGHDFVRWDDYETIVRSERIGPGAPGLGAIWSAPARGLYVPLTETLWHGVALAEARLGASGAEGGPSPAGFHALNVALHALAAAAVFALLFGLTRRELPSAAGALLFALHPLQVEPVAWASGTKDVLAGALGAAALAAYVAAARRSQSGARGGGWRYAGATLLYGLALLAKPNAAAVPLVAAALDLLWLRRPLGRIALWTAPWAAAVLPLALATARAQQGAGLVPEVPWAWRPLVALDALAFALRKLFWPVALAPDYGRSPAWLREHPEALVWVALPLAGAGLCVALRRVRPGIAAGGAAFAAAWLPASGLLAFSFQQYSTVADHYLHLALVGPALAAAAALARARGRLPWVLAAVLLVALGARSVDQQAVWRDTPTLFRHVLEVNPRSFQAHLALGKRAEEAERWVDAVRHYRGALAEREDLPTATAARANLGRALLRTGRPAAAVAELEAALAERPRSARIHSMLGSALLAQGRYREAKAHLHRAWRAEPASAEFANNLAWLLATAPDAGLRDGARAVRLAERARGATGGSEPAVLDTLAAAYAEAGRFEDAVRTARRAVEIARARGNASTAAEVAARLEGYRAGRPHRANAAEP